MSDKNLNPLTPKNKIGIVKKFVEGKLPLDKTIEELGKSRATIYRYAKMVERGEEIIDRRAFGNNRKYGKKK